MKNLSAAFWFVVILSGAACTNANQETSEVVVDTAEVNPSTPPIQQEAPMQDDTVTANDEFALIRGDYTSIMNKLAARQLETDSLRFKCEKEDGDGLLIRHVANNNVVLVEYTKGVGHYSVSKKMYFKNGALFFVFEKEESWGFGGPLDEKGNPGVKSDIEENRFYIDNGVILRHLSKKFTHRSWTDDPTSNEIANEIVEASKGKKYPGKENLAELKKGIPGC